ncbi:MAG TPA: hypothetical protein VD833_05895 [Vicinamibacterales bacterium]|nr:hypothetical protein [Vicinamibacterales bacterium]
MKDNRTVLTTVVVLVVIIVGWWLFTRRGAAEPIDLISHFDAAEKRPDPGLFSVDDATLNGETIPAIAVEPTPGTRLVFKVRIPHDGWLRVSLGLKPESWEKEGDGIKFLVGISDGRTFDQLFSQHVNPFGNEADRRWIPVMVDVSAYAGEEVDLILNTYGSPEGRPGDTQNDFGLWGRPEIVVR